MNADNLTTVATATAGQLVRVTFTDGTDQVVVSQGRTTSKGFAYKMSEEDTKVAYFARTKIESIAPLTDGVDADEDGLTTAALAVIFDTNAKALRVTLRSLGLGVGRGRRYHLTATQVETVRDALAS